jgi:hypothetical protein
MLARCSCLAFVAVLAAGLSGCCSQPWGGCYPCGKNFCDSQCGGLIWHYWFSLPPPCCDPCDGCGHFTGHRLNDGLYSHGNDYHGWCEKRDAHFANYEQVQGEPVQGELIDEPTAAPAQEPYYSDEPEPYPEPGAAEDIPFDSSNRVRRDGYSRPVSHAEAAPGRRRSAQNAPNRRLTSAMYQATVDSRGPSRKLARPPRTRLFSR